MNRIDNGELDTVAGGYHNVITSSTQASISGGNSNYIKEGDNSAIVGGLQNSAFAPLATLVGGSLNTVFSEATSSVVVGGDQHAVYGEFAAVVGGSALSASGVGSSAVGGIQGHATAAWSSVVGGSGNRADAALSTTLGGFQNLGLASRATLAGGNTNTARGNASTLVGGEHNEAIGARSVVVGGSKSSALGHASVVIGGQFNHATGNWSTIAGGVYNQVMLDHGFLGGGVNNSVGGLYGAIGGGSDNVVEGASSAVTGGTSNSVHSEYGSIGGGYSNVVVGYGGVVGGGYWNIVQDSFATVGGGYFGTSSGYAATVGGGWNNVATSEFATISGGQHNRATGANAVVCGGAANVASGNFSVIIGGGDNVGGNVNESYAVRPGRQLAQGRWATVLGGHTNTVIGDESVALGVGGNVSHSRAAVFGFRAGTTLSPYVCPSMGNGSVHMCVENGVHINGAQVATVPMLMSNISLLDSKITHAKEWLSQSTPNFTEGFFDLSVRLDAIEITAQQIAGNATDLADAAEIVEERLNGVNVTVQLNVLDIHRLLKNESNIRRRVDALHASYSEMEAVMLNSEVVDPTCDVAVCELADDVKNLTADQRNHTAALLLMSGHIDDVEAAVEDVETETQQLSAKAMNLTVAAETLKSDLRSVNVTVSSSHVSIVQLQTEVATVVAQVEHINGSVESLEHRWAQAFGGDNSSCNVSICQMAINMDDVKADVANKSDMLMSVDRRTSDVELDMAAMLNETRRLSNVTAGLTQVTASLESQMDDVLDNCADLVNETDFLRSEVETVSARAQQYEQQNVEYQNAIALLELTVSAQQQTIESLSANLSSLTAAVASILQATTFAAAPSTSLDATAAAHTSGSDCGSDGDDGGPCGTASTMPPLGTTHESSTKQLDFVLDLQDLNLDNGNSTPSNADVAAAVCGQYFNGTCDMESGGSASECSSHTDFVLSGGATLSVSTETEVLSRVALVPGLNLTNCAGERNASETADTLQILSDVDVDRFCTGSGSGVADGCEQPAFCGVVSIETSIDGSVVGDSNLSAESGPPCQTGANASLWVNLLIDGLSLTESGNTSLLVEAIDMSILGREVATSQGQPTDGVGGTLLFPSLDGVMLGSPELVTTDTIVNVQLTVPTDALVDGAASIELKDVSDLLRRYAHQVASTTLAMTSALATTSTTAVPPLDNAGNEDSILAGVATAIAAVVVVATVVLVVYFIRRRGGNKVVQATMGKDVELVVPRSRLTRSATRSKMASRRSKRKRASAIAVQRAFQRSRGLTSRKQRRESKVAGIEQLGGPTSASSAIPRASIADALAGLRSDKDFLAKLDKKRSKFQQDRSGSGDSNSDNHGARSARSFTVAPRVRTRISRRQRQQETAVMTTVEEINL